MERIELEEQTAPGYPVVKRTALGQRFNGAVLKAESRDRQKKDEVTGELKPILKSNGKPKQEMVVTCLTMPGTTTPVGLGADDEGHVPEPGDIVRLILKGKAFGDWIDQKRDLPNRVVAVGDVVSTTTTTAISYDSTGNVTGGEITTQSEIDALRAKGRTVGIYGPLTLNQPTSDEWVEKAVKAYRSLQAPVDAETGLGVAREPGHNAAAIAGYMESMSNDVPEPKRPDSITPEAWEQLPLSTKKQLAEIPF